MAKTLYLVDVSSLFFRAFYAVRPLSTPSGQPVNAVYGFLTMILKLIKEEKVENMVFCYDRKEPSFRKDIYDAYKANRTEMPEDLQKQMPLILGLAEKLGIPEITVPRYEADDLIGTLAKKGLAQNYQVVIVSGDKDFAQLLVPGVVMYDTKVGSRIDHTQAKEKWGVVPEQMIDFLALVGDASDNVPGVRGVGPKTAIQLLEQYQTIEEIYENVETLKGSIATKLKESKENAFLSKKLVTIVTDVAEVGADFDWKCREPSWQDLFQLLTDLNFVSLKSQIEKWRDQFNDHSTLIESAISKTIEVQKVSVFKQEIKPEEVLNLWVKNEELAIWIAKHPSGWVIGHDERNEWALVIDHAELLRMFASCRKIFFSGFDLKSIWHDLRVQGPIGALWDGLLVAYVLRAGENWTWPRAYEFLTGEVLEEFQSPAEMLESLLRAKHWSQTKLLSQEKVFNEIERPLIPILYGMEVLGIKLDIEELQKQSQEVFSLMVETEKAIYSVANQTFNILSPKQLGRVLFEDLGLPPVRKTKTGYSTDEDTLSELESKHPIAKLIINYRELSKLRSTYLESLPKLVDQAHRVHTTFAQATTTTGRLSSVDPNLQNIPIRTERGAKVRRAFIADEGKSLLSLDYSQIELRILAHMSRDPGLIEAFEQGIDIHTRTAAEVFDVSLASVSADQRRTAKAINFGIAYGQGAFGLSQVLGIDRKEAQNIIDRYFSRFSNVKLFIEETIKLASETGFVETLFGRRRYLPEINSQNQNLRKAGERAAINAPIQGSAADLIKLAMVRMPHMEGVKMLLQIHDELIFEGSLTNLEMNLPVIKKVMQEVYPLRVPLVVNGAIGKTWDDSH